MARPSNGKINVLKIAKEHLFQSKTAKYLDIAIWPNKNGTDEYGNTHYITQSVGKEARDRGEKGAIIGNLKWVDAEETAPAPRQKPAPRTAPPKDADLDVEPDEVPF